MHDDPFNLLYAMIERLHILQDKHLISCVCDSKDIDLDIENGNIVIRCAHCGRTKKLEVSEDSLLRMLNTNAIIIGN